MRKTISIQVTKITAGELKRFLTQVPNLNTPINIQHHSGDRPFDAGYTTISATWEEE